MTARRGRKSTVTGDKAQRLIKEVGTGSSVRSAANAAGVSKDAAERYLDSLPAEVAPEAVARQGVADQIILSIFDTRAVLERNYQRVERLIGQLEAGIKLVRTVRGQEYVTQVSPEVLIAALKEARGYANSASRLYELLISAQETQAFRAAVLEAIGEADEDTRKRILLKLQERRALELAF